MSTLRLLKLSLLHATRGVGLFKIARNSRGRAQQLLILCYHGISIADEHEWAPGLYLSAEYFESRLERLRGADCAVLPLGEAVRRLYDGSLPPRSVALTFDDGNFDFYSRAWPAIRKYRYPVTVYLTTHYCEHNVAVFPVVVSYVLWKARGAVLSFELDDGRTVKLDTRSSRGRDDARSALIAHVRREGLTTSEQDDLVRRLANELGVDYAEISRRRMMHLMNADEVRELAAAGVDFQLHTHRHRSPLDRERYRDEVRANRARISAWSDHTPTHFCYPSGVWKPQFMEWLREEGVASATTCEPGIATRASNRYRLPRLLDHSDLTPVEFDAWLAGLGPILPRRHVAVTPVDDMGRLVVDAAAEAATT